jgi:hypothetical protein
MYSIRLAEHHILKVSGLLEVRHLYITFALRMRECTDLDKRADPTGSRYADMFLGRTLATKILINSQHLV